LKELSFLSPIFPTDFFNKIKINNSEELEEEPPALKKPKHNIPNSGTKAIETYSDSNLITNIPNSGTKAIETYSDSDLITNIPNSGTKAIETYSDSDLITNIPNETYSDSDLITVFNMKAAGFSSLNDNRDYIDLFQRDDLLKVFSTMLNFDKSIVQGPPGSGKSVASWAYCSYLGCKNTVFWLRFVIPRNAESGNISAVIITKNKLFTLNYSFNCNINVFLKSLFKKFPDLKYIFIDGNFQPGFLSDITGYLNGNNMAGVVLHADSSLQMDFSSQYRDSLGLIEEDSLLSSNSWNLSDYLTSLKFPKIKKYATSVLFGKKSKFSKESYVPDKDENYDGVSNVTDTDILLNDAAVFKYYYCGNNARWFYDYSLERVLKEIATAIERVSNMNVLFKRDCGEKSKDAVNQLGGGNLNRPLVSQYVVRFLYEKYEHQFLEMAFQSDLYKDNGPFRGWIVETEFWHQVKVCSALKSPLCLERKSSSSAQSFLNFPCNNVLKAELGSDVPDLCPSPGDWLAPWKINQGCYDFVYFHDTDTIYLFQVTVGKSHVFKLNYIIKLVNCLNGTCKIKNCLCNNKTWKLTIKSIKVYVVTILENFKIYHTGTIFSGQNGLITKLNNDVELTSSHIEVLLMGTGTVERITPRKKNQI
jgi:hypothetical protein